MSLDIPPREPYISCMIKYVTILRLTGLLLLVGGGPHAFAADVAAPLSAETLAKANIEEGHKYARVCSACHSLGKGEPDKIGPNLYGIVGAKHAHRTDYDYSDAMRALSGTTWTVENLNVFLYAPRATIPGSRMFFGGIKDDNDRANVIAWLRTLSDNPAPVPAK